MTNGGGRVASGGEPPTPPLVDRCPRSGDHSPDPPSAALLARWPAILPFLVLGSICTIAGGLVAAVSRPTDFGHGPWLAAYLVLVGGVSQIGLGAGQALLAGALPSRANVRIEVTAWNVGLLCVVAGTLVPSPLLTTVGSTVTALALILLVGGARAPAGPASRARGIFLALAVTLLVSMPVGVVLAWTRHG